MNSKKYIYREGFVSIFVNTLLFALKLWAGIVSNSVALTADAWHTLSDSISSIVVIGGAKLSSQKADSKHPFGHGRWEYISTFLISIFLGIIAFEFFKDAVEQFKNQESANYGTVAIVVTCISIVGKELLAQYAFYIGRKTGDSSVKADAWHHRSDALSSFVVLGGIFLQDVFWWIDSALGVIVALVILQTAYKIVKDAISKLLGEDLSTQQMEHINNIISSVYDERIEAHHFHFHNYGKHQELTFHIRLDPDITIAEGHKITTDIEMAIEANMEIDTTIHVEEFKQ
jgi:cation diffusion facilitator family transporter